MQKLIKILFKDKVLYLSIGITLFIAYLSLKKINSPLPFEFSGADKIYHTIAYFIFGLFWLFSFPKSLKSANVKYVVVFLCMVYGIIIEVLQMTLTTYRTISLLDMVANAVGIVLAMLFFKSIYKKILAI